MTEPASGFHMRVGKPGMDGHIGILTASEAKNASHNHFCNGRREMRLQQGHDVGCPRHTIHRHDGKQHQKRAGERIKKEFETRVDPPSAAPHANDENIGMRPPSKKDKRARDRGRRNPDIRVSRTRKATHIFLDASLNRFPGRENADRHQESGQRRNGKDIPSTTHLVDETLAEPALFLNQLKGG